MSAELLSASKSIQTAPNYGTHRKGVAVADAANPTDVNKGTNCAPWRVANIQIVPETAAGNPTVEVLFWSPAAGKFIPDYSTDYQFVAKGAGVPWETSIAANGRIVFVKLTGTMTGGISVYISGNDLSAPIE